MIDWLRKQQMEPEIELDGRIVPIELKRHARARRLTLRVAPDGSAVKLTLPQWARSAEALAFAHAKRDWLAEQLAKLPQRSAPQPGSVIRIRDEVLHVEWDEDAPRKPARHGTKVILGGPLVSLEARLRRWCETQAIDAFEDDTRYYCEAAGLEPVPVALSRAQKRWGSCSDRKRIRLNWRLIQAPDFVRRSVVAHEITHLVHFDHSPAFHAMLASIFEGDIAKADRWLKINGRGLYASFG